MGIVLRNRYRKRFRTTWTVILILLIVVMGFVHTLSSLILMISVFLLFLTFAFFEEAHGSQNRMQFISMTFVTLAVVLPVLYWSYNADAPEMTFLARVALTVKMSIEEAFLGMYRWSPVQGCFRSGRCF